MRIRKFQQGGQMGGGQQDPLVQIVEMAMQAVQNKDGQLALSVCQELISLVQSAMNESPQQGGPQEGPQGEQPQEQPQEMGEPVYRRGGRLIRRK